ncbi:MAG: endonuclease III [Oscillospiraceae bacterium]|jgi:endonuclease-3|nr:endonuclease III [Oscillospiraceae bacterium]
MTLNILTELARLYPHPRSELDFGSPFELLIATMLAAQCTDRQVNRVTPALFAAFPDPASIAAQAPETIEPYIHACGFYHTKARNIVKACRVITEQYGGEVPRDMDALTALPGVGRKTANVVTSNAFGADAIAVDTHVLRVSNRLGLAHAKTPEQTERQLMLAIPKRDWSDAHHWLIFHGRRVCHARKPECDNCTLAEYCKARLAESANLEVV